jgi:hypothetical protein
MGRGTKLYIALNVYLYTYVSRVEEGSNTSTVALRVVGGDEKESQCLGV